LYNQNPRLQIGHVNFVLTPANPAGQSQVSVAPPRAHDQRKLFLPERKRSGVTLNVQPELALQPAGRDAPSKLSTPGIAALDTESLANAPPPCRPRQRIKDKEKVFMELMLGISRPS
jgi:hypothetical protein